MMKQNNLTETMSFNSEEIRRETIHEVLKPVSYTHLDVYKRQTITVPCEV